MYWAPTGTYLQHFGIPGMKWGVRRWQYKDGRFNEAGKIRYFGQSVDKKSSEQKLDHNRIGGPVETGEIIERLKRAGAKTEKSKRMSSEEKKKLAKKIAIGVGIAAGIGLATYGIYRYKGLDASASAIQKGKESFARIEKDGFDMLVDNLDDADVIIEKNRELHRMHAYAGFDPTKVKGPLYAAVEKNDVDVYKTLMRDWSGTGKRYDVTLEAVKTLKSPGKKTRVETFIDLWNNNKKYRDGLTDAVFSEKGHGFKSKNDAKTMLDRMATTDPDQLYRTAIWALVKPGKAANIYIDTIKQKGYNAIVDDNDVMNKLSKMPIILLDAKNDVVKKGQHIVTEGEYIQAFMNVVKSKHPDTSIYEFSNESTLIDIGRQMFNETFRR